MYVQMYFETAFEKRLAHLIVYSIGLMVAVVSHGTGDVYHCTLEL